MSKKTVQLYAALAALLCGWWSAAAAIRVQRILVNAGTTVDPLLVNTYIVYDEQAGDAVIVDPGARDERIEAFIAGQKLKVGRILNTHGHYDHTGGNRHYADLYGVKIMAHKEDLFLYTEESEKNRPGEFFSDSASITVGSLMIKVLHTPGHSPGSVCFLLDGKLLSGDTLFAGGVGRSPGENERRRQESLAREIASIKSRLLVLPFSTVVYPGHGRSTTIGEERLGNPYLLK